MSGLTFEQQWILMLTDKLIIAGLLLGAAFLFNMLLEKFKRGQAQELERFRTSQAEVLQRLQASQARELERLRNTFSRRDETLRSTRMAVAQVASKLAATSHAICWVTWPARYCPEDLTQQRLEDYDKEINGILADLMAARVVLAGWDPTSHAALDDLVRDLEDLDADVGEAKAKFNSARADSLRALTSIHEEAENFDDRVLDTVTQLACFKDHDAAAPEVSSGDRQ
jgi:hypothetical protein